MAYMREDNKKTRTRRAVESGGHAFLLELHPDGLELKPLRSRTEDAEVFVRYSTIYHEALIKRAPAPKRGGRRVRRSVI